MGLFSWLRGVFGGPSNEANTAGRSTAAAKSAAPRPTKTPKKPVKPTVPPVVEAETTPSPEPLLGPAGDVEAELDAALDDFFADREPAKVAAGAATAPPVVTPPPSTFDDKSANRELFAHIAGNHTRPVKEFIFELRHGSAPTKWIEICRPVLATVADAARSMEFTDLVEDLQTLDRELEKAQNNRKTVLNPTARDRILSLYERLEKLEPNAFAIDENEHRQESIIVDSLLRQIPEVGYVTIEKLYRIGLTTRESLFLATASDLTNTAGIPAKLAARVADWLADYRNRNQGLDEDALKERQKAELVRLVQELRSQHDRFRKACENVSVDESLAEVKTDSRNRRKSVALEIEVALAEMNELVLAQKVQNLPFAQRLAELETFVSGMGGAPKEAEPAVAAVARPESKKKKRKRTAKRG